MSVINKTDGSDFVQRYRRHKEGPAADTLENQPFSSVPTRVNGAYGLRCPVLHRLVFEIN